jgi:hypothetical protein
MALSRPPVIFQLLFGALLSASAVPERDALLRTELFDFIALTEVANALGYRFADAGPRSLPDLVSRLQEV